MRHPTHNAKSALIGIMLGSLALNAQADLYEDGLMAYTTGNFAEAGQLLVSAAENGNSGAEHLLMRLYSEGHLEAVNQDQETLKWTRKAAESGIKQAQYGLAEIYAKNPDTLAESVQWYRKAANQGHPKAFFKLGDILKAGGRSVAADAGESTRMYQIAASEFDVFAQKGHADYQYLLGTMYQLAKGVNKNMDLALKWLGKSAMQGHILAQMTLGRIYASGIDIPRDTSQARYWLNLAAAQGYNDAISALDELNNSDDATVAYAM